MNRWMVAVLVFIAFVVPSAAMDSNLEASRKNVEAFVKQAAEYAKTHGKENALKEFNNPQGKFTRGELYIFAYDFEGTVLALGSKPAMAGNNLIRMKDPNGVEIIVELIKAARQGGGWVKYAWENPVKKKVLPKHSFVVKMDDSWWLGSGLYESE